MRAGFRDFYTQQIDFLGIFRVLTPVSYTHLDVYKRQDLRRSSLHLGVLRLPYTLGRIYLWDNLQNVHTLEQAIKAIAYKNEMDSSDEQPVPAVITKALHKIANKNMAILKLSLPVSSKSMSLTE